MEELVDSSGPWPKDCRFKSYPCLITWRWIFCIGGTWQGGNTDKKFKVKNLTSVARVFLHEMSYIALFDWIQIFHLFVSVVVYVVILLNFLYWDNGSILCRAEECVGSEAQNLASASRPTATPPKKCYWF